MEMEMPDDRQMQMHRYLYLYLYFLYPWGASISREKCAISAYLMPMHFECKRQANAISFQSRAELPSHPVTPPPNSSTSVPPLAKFTAHLLHCHSTWQLLHRDESVAPKVVSTAPHPSIQRSRWLMGYSSGNVFSLSLAADKWQVASRKSLDLAAKKTATQSVFCQPPDKLGPVEISTKILQRRGPGTALHFPMRKYVAHQG